jgi:hypothetical protein
MLTKSKTLETVNYSVMLAIVENYPQVLLGFLGYSRVLNLVVITAVGIGVSSVSVVTGITAIGVSAVVTAITVSVVTIAGVSVVTTIVSSGGLSLGLGFSLSLTLVELRDSMGSEGGVHRLEAGGNSGAVVVGRVSAIKVGGVSVGGGIGTSVQEGGVGFGFGFSLTLVETVSVSAIAVVTTIVSTVSTIS